MTELVPQTPGRRGTGQVPRGSCNWNLVSDFRDYQDGPRFVQTAGCRRASELTGVVFSSLPLTHSWVN